MGAVGKSMEMETSEVNPREVVEHELMQQSGFDKMDVEVEGKKQSSEQGNAVSGMLCGDSVTVELKYTLEEGSANTNVADVEEVQDSIIDGESKKGSENPSATDKKGEIEKGDEDRGVSDKREDATKDGGSLGTMEVITNDSGDIQNGQIGETLEKGTASVVCEEENGEQIMDVEEKEEKFEDNQARDKLIRFEEKQMEDKPIHPEEEQSGHLSVNSKDNQVGEMSAKVEKKQNQDMLANHNENPNGGTLLGSEENLMRVTLVKAEVKQTGEATGNPAENQMKDKSEKSTENQMADASIKLEDRHSEDTVPKHNELHLKHGFLKKDTVNGEGSKQPFAMQSRKTEGDDSGTEEEQAAFMRELQNFYKERSMDFKPPKFYGEGLNCLKLWRAVTRLGGYEQVTQCKLWRQVGESFKPPKTCTTVSWTFRCFYEKALLEYEKHKIQIGELEVSVSATPEPVSVENQVGICQTSGSGRARRDAAARAMQGWHSQRLLGNGEVGDPIIKDKSSTFVKRDKQLKSVGIFKRKKSSSFDRSVKATRISTDKPQTDSMVVDVGPPAEWVKINVRRTKDCFEVYALVPGLLREEVHVQSDAAGSLVISGEPEQLDNPWGVTPFKKIVTLPSRIDPHQTSAIVTLHGQLFVRAPFEHPGS